MPARFFLALPSVPHNLCVTPKSENFPNSNLERKERVVLTVAAGTVGSQTPGLEYWPCPVGQPWPLSEP